MQTVLTDRRSEIEALCRRYGVRRLEVFGSAATEQGFDPVHSDVDFLVEFHEMSTMGPADQYFGLLADLQALFQRDVDLVTVRGLRNPYFIRAVNRTKKVLYIS